MTQDSRKFIETIHKILDPLRMMVRLAIGKGQLVLVDDSGKFQRAQASLLKGELTDGTEVWGHYGLASHAHPGAELVYLSVGGIRAHGAIVAIEDRRYRLAGLAEGEVALYDDQGGVVHLRRDGIHIESPLDVTVKSGKTLRLEGDTVQIHAKSLHQQDVAGLGSQTFALGANQWRTVAWTAGSVMVPAPPRPVQPPEIG